MALKRRQVISSIAARLTDDLRMDETASFGESTYETGHSEDLLTWRIHVLVGLKVPDSATGGALER